MPLLAKRVDDLKRLTFRHDGIVFDDVDFRGWPPTEVIALLDYNIPRSLGARFHDVRLDAFFPIIMTSNVYPIFPAGDNAEQDTAIEPRSPPRGARDETAAAGRPRSRKARCTLATSALRSECRASSQRYTERACVTRAREPCFAYGEGEGAAHGEPTIHRASVCDACARATLCLR